MSKKQDPNPYAYGYARMPRIIRKGYKNLTNMQKLLYIYLRDLCGEDGTCYRSLRSLKDETGFSIGYLSAAIPILHNEGLIHAEMRKNRSTHWEVWHISIVDIWEKNAQFLQEEKEKCSPDEQMDEQSVQDMNRSVHQMNSLSESVQEVNESVHAMTLNKNHTNNQLTKNNDREDIASPVVDAPANIIPENRLQERITDKHKAINLKGNTNVPQSQFRHPLSNLDSAVASDSGRAALVEPSTEKGQEVDVPGNTVRTDISSSVDPGASDGLPTRISETVAQQTTSVPPVEAVRQAAIAHAANNQLPQVGEQRGARKRKETPVIELKSDTRELQRRINAHRGYALEERVDIVRERQAIKSWCNLHTVEEYERVMLKLKSDPYWGKPENYVRIGGLTLAKETPKALAAPIPIESKAPSNGVDHERNKRHLEELSRRFDEEGPKLKGLELRRHA